MKKFFCLLTVLLLLFSVGCQNPEIVQPEDQDILTHTTPPNTDTKGELPATAPVDTPKDKVEQPPVTAPNNADTPQKKPTDKADTPSTDKAVTPTDKPVTPATKPVDKPPETSSTPPEDVASPSTCTLIVSCETLLNSDALAPEKKDILPENGIIFPTKTIEIEDGESVFDLLKRTMREQKIHMEYVNTPIYNSAYIEGIGNFYEFDSGPLSGWMYRVNGEFPSYGSSRYTIKDGDKIEWLFTCDLGKDIGSSTGAMQKE